MKRIAIILVTVCISTASFSQSQEIQQLLLNVEKLTQLKQILSDMYKGYEVVSKGYNTIRDISQGNFSLHQLFLDGLMQVSPTVRKYKKVADIISYQTMLVKEYKTAFGRFKNSSLFNVPELNYMGSVYGNLFERSLQNLDELAMVVTAGKLRMSDEERLTAIDRIAADMTDKLVFLRNFNRGNDVLAVQRGRENVDTKVSQRLNGL
ncbi:MAG: TerB family tellurite resistance protein [Sediminibacterium sp.]